MHTQQWIYLSKKGTDEYINRFARGAGVAPTPIEDWTYEQEPEKGLVIRGIMKHKIMKRCWEDGRPFRYMDTGYFGNRPSAQNPNGWKWYHRIVNNDLQHGDIVPHSSDRWQRLKIPIRPWRRDGRNIVIVMPDEKACLFYDTTPQAWLASVMAQLAGCTDRPIVIRQRVADPDARTRDANSSFDAVLRGDTFAIIAFNSVAATEAVVAGIPAFVTTVPNAARPVANRDLKNINDPWYPDADLMHAWACHLAYGQFHISELEDGSALHILDGMA